MRSKLDAMLTAIRDTVLLAPMLWLGSVAMADESSPTAEQLSVELRATERQVRLILGDVMRHGTFDAPAVLGVVDNDPEKLASWVQEHTTYVPYQGVVRDAFGVLQDRLGNHLDRAMLLGRLIEESGRAVRLEVMDVQELSPAVQLLDERPRPQPVSITADTQELLNHLSPRSNELQPDRPDPAVWNRFDQDLQARAISLIERLAGDSGFPAWDEISPAAEREADPRVRVWWENDQGRWVSTDLSEGMVSAAADSPSAESQSLSAASRRYAHRYQLEVIAERWQEGRFERVTLLEHDLEAHALAMQAIRVGVVPEQFEVDGFYAGDPDQALANDLLANTAWIPYIRYGEELILGDLIDEQGSVRDPMLPAQARQLEEATSLLGGISVGGRAKQNESHNAFIGLSLEVTHRYGDEVLNRLSRPWFSLVPEEASAFDLEPEQRLERAVALVRDSNILLQVAEPSEALLWRYGLGLFLRNTHALKGMIMALDDADFETLDGAIHELVDLPQTAMQFARHRFTASLNPERFYIGEPNLLIEHVGLKHLPEGFRDYRAIDLAHVPLNLVPSDDDARQLRFSQGVLETLLEAELLALRNPLPDRDKGLDGENAALHLEAAMASGEVGLWLAPGEASRLDDLMLPRLSRLAIQHQLAQGQHLYFPLAASLEDGAGDKALPLAWWVVDTDSGQALGYGGVGWGSFVDYSMLLQTRLYLLATSLAPGGAKVALGTFLACGFASAMLSLHVYSTLGGELPQLVDMVAGESLAVVEYCLKSYVKMTHPTL
ncbi:hypothetical protein CK497_10140 [Vreelandella alkaliphila]|uniref:Uncharacterized protein n=2 Tax=Vreelandella alkaliphila TaxID=272774 RepID=A0ABX4HHY5_9GAMM|nr:hypothetical protein CK497_10140 [Halomonas humidisoli]